QAAADYHQTRGQRTLVVEIERERLKRLRRLLADDVSLHEAWYVLNRAALDGRAASATVEALMFSLRLGIKALDESDTQRRISELSEEQLHEVGGRLQRLKPEIARAWTAEEIERLAAA